MGSRLLCCLCNAILEAEKGERSPTPPPPRRRQQEPIEPSPSTGPGPSKAVPLPSPGQSLPPGPPVVTEPIQPSASTGSGPGPGTAVPSPTLSRGISLPGTPPVVTGPGPSVADQRRSAGAPAFSPGQGVSLPSSPPTVEYLSQEDRPPGPIPTHSGVIGPIIRLETGRSQYGCWKSSGLSFIKPTTYYLTNNPSLIFASNLGPYLRFFLKKFPSKKLEKNSSEQCSLESTVNFMLQNFMIDCYFTFAVSLSKHLKKKKILRHCTGHLHSFYCGPSVAPHENQIPQLQACKYSN